MAASRLRLNMDKTELMWTGTRYNMSKIPVCSHFLTLGVCPCRCIRRRPCRVLLTPDLAFNKHVTAKSSFSYVDCVASDVLSTTTQPLLFVHAFVASWVDYCGSLLIGAAAFPQCCGPNVSNTHKHDQELLQFRRSIFFVECNWTYGMKI